jgi:hypothetical protein
VGDKNLTGNFMFPLMCLLKSGFIQFIIFLCLSAQSKPYIINDPLRKYTLYFIYRTFYSSSSNIGGTFIFLTGVYRVRFVYHKFYHYFPVL